MHLTRSPKAGDLVVRLRCTNVELRIQLAESLFGGGGGGGGEETESCTSRE